MKAAMAKTWDAGKSHIVLKLSKPNEKGRTETCGLFHWESTEATVSSWNLPALEPAGLPAFW